MVAADALAFSSCLLRCAWTAWALLCRRRMSPRFLFVFLPLLVVGCSDPLPDIFDAPSADVPVAPVAVGEAATIDVRAAAGRTVSIDSFECVGCSARVLSRNSLGGRFEVTSTTPGTARLRVHVRNGENRPLVVEREIVFSTPARIDGFRRFVDAKTGSAVPAVRGTTQTLCFSVASAAGDLLIHDRARLSVASTGTVDSVDVDDTLEIPRGLATLSTSRCIEVIARERGAGEVTLRFGSIERRLAFDVVEPDDMMSLDVIDARFRSALPPILDVGTDVVASESTLAEVRGSCRGGLDLFVRGTLVDGRTTLVPLEAASVRIEPAGLARADVNGALVSLSRGVSGTGTLTIASGLATKTLPFRVECESP